MTRNELIEKTEQLCELYKELEKEGVYGIMHSMGEVRIQCEGYTLKKIAGDIPTETRERATEEYPTETLVKLDKFTAFALGDIK
jgi:hypothetical protein